MTNIEFIVKNKMLIDSIKSISANYSLANEATPHD
jgi:hypothetical protein